ncbi:DMT family transporter [Aquimarina hainanensis]|uniref:DMT family transporter n=1 Tax=Aquimarina hainanensis TaxID=1578017 RepID=A0ABW5N8T1_9FLAO|nr:DMT family transporter [Aquimarina sp. TRL1]QKX05493.1 DMT family transporter [Aquimarina sp. TRL1]
MNYFNLILLAFLGGVFLAIQGALNARLGVLLKSPLLATVIAYGVSVLFALICVFFKKGTLPTVGTVRNIPFYMWFSGGVFSVVGILLYYYTIPRLGVGTMISFGLCGQLILAVIAGHFGWLQLPEEPLTLKKIIGVVTMIVGIVLINIK